jgi:hypothetical protein
VNPAIWGNQTKNKKGEIFDLHRGIGRLARG